MFASVIYPYELYTAANGHLYAGVYYQDSTGQGWRIYRSTNDGATWQIIVTQRNEYIDCFYLTATDTLLVGTEYGLYIAAADGSGYTYSAFDRATQFAATADGRIYLATSSGLMISSDNGNTWQATGLSSNVFAVAVNQEGTLFTASFGSYLCSTNGGVTWTNIQSGIPTIYTSSYIVQPSIGILYDGSLGYGVYRSINTTLAASEPTTIPGDILLTRIIQIHSMAPR